MTNGFGSTAHQYIVDTCAPIISPWHLPMLKQRITKAIVSLSDPDDGMVYDLQVGCGGLQGCSTAMKTFLRPFTTALEDWKPTEDFFYSSIPCNPGHEVDVSCTTFVDDILKITNVELHTAVNAGDLVKQSNDTLDQCLHSHGYHQARSKQELVGHLRNPKQHRKLYTDGLFAGRMLIDMRYLGIRYHPMNYNTKERELRLRAMRSGWSQMGKFWSSDSPDKVKRVVFICHVLNAGYSGMETMIPARVDHDALDKTAVALLRSLLKGKASWDTDTHKRSLTNIQVWKKWRLVPSAIELTVRRLLFFLSVLVHHMDNVQVVSSLFGDPHFQRNLDVMQGEPAFTPTLDEEGVIDWDNANPWACRYLRDLEKLSKVHEGSFQQLWQPGNVHQLLQDGPVRDAMLLLDPTVLRAQFLLSAEEEQPVVCTVVEEPPAECFRCDIGLPDGQPCNLGQPFFNKKTYLLHLQKKHRMCEKEYQNIYVLTNVCPLCETVLKTRLVACNHFQRSVLQGRCIGKSKDKHQIIMPHSLQCKQCLFTANSLTQLHSHFKSNHFDFVDPNHLAQSNSFSSGNP